MSELFGVQAAEIDAQPDGTKQPTASPAVAPEPSESRTSLPSAHGAPVELSTRSRERRSETSPTRRHDSARKGYVGLVLFRAAGLMLGGIGSLILVMPQMSSVAAEFLASHNTLRSQAGTLIVAGVCMFTYSLLRLTLEDLRGSLDSMSKETTRLKEIAADGVIVRDMVRTVSMENASLTRELLQLQTHLKQLMGIVSNPDFTVSLFRLAASVDQLGKQVHTSQKDQFEQLQQRMHAVAEHLDRAEKQLTGNLLQIPALMRDQHKAQQASAQKSFDLLHSAAEGSEDRLDRSLQATARIESAIHGQQELATEGFVRVLEGSDQNARELAQSLNELRAHLDALIETQSSSVQTEFVALDGKLATNARNRAAEIAQLAEQIDRQIDGHVVELQRTWSALTELQGDDHRALAEGFDQLSTRFGEHASAQLASIGDVRRDTVQATTAAVNGLVTSLGGLETRLEQQAREQQSLVQETAAAAREQADASQREWARCLLELSTQLELLEQEQRRGLADAAQQQALAQSTAAAAREQAEASQLEWTHRLL
ncbi:MAG TPA: hypothetical protein VM509_10890, partial [Planctomycetota bacterium]|nr:hypothetical protein [Planctomycetota bacterium]